MSKKSRIKSLTKEEIKKSQKKFDDKVKADPQAKKLLAIEDQLIEDMIEERKRRKSKVD